MRVTIRHSVARFSTPAPPDLIYDRDSRENEPIEPLEDEVMDKVARDFVLSSSAVLVNTDRLPSVGAMTGPITYVKAISRLLALFAKVLSELGPAEKRRDKGTMT